MNAKKFVIDETTYFFVESGNYLFLSYNNKNGNIETEYTITSIATLPETQDQALYIIRLNIWYPVE